MLDVTEPTKIAVFGSLNVDYYCRVAAFPKPGETLTAEELVIRFGGKGANQAVAAARMGAQVRMLGRVGDDGMGHAYRERLASEGIDHANVVPVSGVATGSAFITLNAEAENTIVVASGANGTWRGEDVQSLQAAIAEADVLLLQGEVPVEAILAAMAGANAAGTTVIFNPSPWPAHLPWGKASVDMLIVNEHEASTFFGTPITMLSDLQACAERAAARKVFSVVVTRGSRSTFALSGNQAVEVPVRLVNPVDTVGAGDTFTGGLAAMLAGMQSGEISSEDAIHLANVAAGLATLKTGAQEAMPGLAEVWDAARGMTSGA